MAIILRREGVDEIILVGAGLTIEPGEALPAEYQATDIPVLCGADEGGVSRSQLGGCK